MMTMIGQVSEQRYQQLVAEGRELVEQQTRSQFGLGDKALEIEPIRARGGQQAGPHEVGFEVQRTLGGYAEEIGVPVNTLLTYRWVASRWPVRYRVAGVSFSIHHVLADLPDEQERWASILDPPLHEDSGRVRWTYDGAKHRVGQRPNTPRSVEEKVQAAHDMVAQEDVAVRVAQDLLRRPDVAFRAMADPTTRHLVNRAQVDQAQQAARQVRDAVPALPRIEHTMEFVDLVARARCSSPRWAGSSRPCAARTSPTTSGRRCTATSRRSEGWRTGSRPPSIPGTPTWTRAWPSCFAASEGRDVVPSMRSGPLAAAVCGEQVRLALVEARPAGLHLRQLVPATGLTVHQVRKGIK
jgi:hypothetical protein